jgi:DNA-binding PadR family transcriptional regulator
MILFGLTWVPGPGMVPKRADPQVSRPLKPIVFQTLLVLFDGERHGWGIVREVERRAGGALRVLPGNLYRTLREMTSAGLIEESGYRPDLEHDDERRRYFRLTRAGREAAQVEARRLHALVGQARALKLIPTGKP